MSATEELGIALLRLGCALAAGGALGWERELQDKPAGLRTNMIVALGAALLMLVGVKHSEATAGANGSFGPEVGRIIQGIVGGIGFLGAGTILQSRRSVHGLTTASTLWLSAAHGIASGLGYYVLTFASVTLALIVLAAFGFLERVWFSPQTKTLAAGHHQQIGDSARKEERDK